MKKLLILAAASVLGAALSASAQVQLTFDENGGNSPLGLQSRVFLDSNPDGNGPAGGARPSIICTRLTVTTTTCSWDGSSSMTPAARSPI